MLDESLRTYLTTSRARYAVHERSPAIVRTVLLRALTHPPGQLMLVVLPAAAELDLERLHQQIGFPVELAATPDVHRLFPYLRGGLVPPLGELAMGELPVFVDAHVALAPVIAFGGGDDGELVEMTWPEYQRIARHRIIDCTRHDDGPA